MFRTVVISKPEFFDGEAEAIVALLDSGKADLMHIRKPECSKEELRKLLKYLPTRLYKRIVLHDHHDLAIEFGLKGVHLNSRYPTPPQSSSLSISRSCHTLEEVKAWKERCDYVSLSPIFDSISKPGYRSAFDAKEIIEAVNSGIIDRKVYALGGVTFDRLDEVEKMGFGGAMILGDAWKEE